MISYSGLVTYGKATLPSVESVNVIKDPPKSVHTRRVDKVGDTSALLATLDEGVDRFCESINYYARGVNPMVSVQYNNTDSATQAYLPYRVNLDGSFRPPVLTQRDLQPLNRQPRVWTSVKSQPVIEDMTKMVYNCDLTPDNSRQLMDKIKYQCESRRMVELDAGHCDDPTRNRRLIKDNVLTPGICISNKTGAYLKEDALTTLTSRNIKRVPDATLESTASTNKDGGSYFSASNRFDAYDATTKNAKLNVPVSTIDNYATENIVVNRYGNFNEERPLYNRLIKTCDRGEYDGRPSSIPLKLNNYSVSLNDKPKIIGR